METVFTKLPLKDNYFWRVYLTGEYAQDCCRSILRPENFEALKTSVVNRVTTHTSSVLAFVNEQPAGQIYGLCCSITWTG